MQSFQTDEPQIRPLRPRPPDGEPWATVERVSLVRPDLDHRPASETAAGFLNRTGRLLIGCDGADSDKTFDRAPAVRGGSVAKACHD